MRLIAFLGECGLARPMIAWMPEKMIPPAAVPLYAATPGSYEIVFQSKLWHAVYGEALALETSDAQVAEIGSMGDLHLIVIRRGKSASSNYPPSEAETLEQQWRTFQEEIAAQSSAGKIVVATESAHGIQAEQPAIIIEAVQELLDAFSK